MKKIRGFLVLITIIGFLYSCSKHTLETKASFSDADVLLSQVKHDTNYIKFMIGVGKLSQMAIENARQHPRPEGSRAEDSVYMRSKTIPLKEKFEKMNYDGYDLTMQIIKENYESYMNLAKRYPLWGKLTVAEQEKYTIISDQYYRKHIKTIK
jgi:hypothetical protein